jgi:CheY-like chemotaxis protein
MNAILGYSQLVLRDPNLGSETAASLKVINRSGEHLLTIINDVLDMAKIEAGHLNVTPKAFNLPSLLRHLEAIFRMQAAANGVEFVLQTTGEPLEYIVADEGKIRQVLINLLGNAVKFTERGRIGLRVNLNDRADERLWLSVEVEDSGIGMTAEEQENLFQPFIQGERGLNHHHGGTGLGLAICRGMATAMNGKIGVASKPGSGSTFHFEIPIERGAPQVFEARSGRRGQVLGIRSGPDAPRILIADDMPNNREWLGKLLQLMGFAVRTAENGEVAVQVWKEWQPQLVLMDIHMPVMNGFEATRSIRATPEGEHTIVIILTADAMEHERADALASGVDGFFSKPFRDDDLLENICNHLGLTYSYDEEKAGHDEPAAIFIAPDELGAPGVPADLVAQMRHAVMHGDKVLLDSLILTIEDRGDMESAAKLRAMANRYQYDRLIEILENA